MSKKLNIEDLPTTFDGRIDWKTYFGQHAQVGDKFEVPRTMRSGIQRQAAECGFTAQSVTVNELTILITVNEPESASRRILAQLASLSEAQLVKIHLGCMQAGILGPF
jgi:hypothetical protein